MLDGALGPYVMAGMIAVAVAAAVFALAYPLFSGERQKDKRLQDVSAARGGRKLGTSGNADQGASRKKNVAETLKEIETRQKAKEKITLRLRLQRAGIDMSPRDFYIASAISGVLLGGAVFTMTSAPPVAAATAAFVGALGLPRWYLSKATKKRQNKFLAELANAIDVVVRGVKSGLPLNECLGVIARESADPLGGEFREVVEQQRLGVTLGEALDRMCDRIPLPEVRFLTIVISIQQQAGGNLSEALSNLAGVLRDRFSLQMKVKALSAEAKASAIVLASLPPGVMFMVYISSPEYIMPLFTTTIGRFMIGVGACWMMTGVLIMRKMINFKF
jgi:tight adherence protein B